MQFYILKIISGINITLLFWGHLLITAMMLERQTLLTLTMFISKKKKKNYLELLAVLVYFVFCDRFYISFDCFLGRWKCPCKKKTIH